MILRVWGFTIQIIHFVLDMFKCLVYKYVMQSKDTKNGIGKRVKTYRLEREWSLAQMSKVTRIAASALWYIENGSKPSDLTIHKLTKALPGLFDFEPKTA
jgi:predicted transcriptional regulator